MKQHQLWTAFLVAGLILACAIPSGRFTTTAEPTPTFASTPVQTSTATPTMTPTVQPTPTPTPTVPTSTPMPVPTPTAPAEEPTPTPEVKTGPKAYDLSDVRIRVEDLPPGFFPFDLSMFGMPGFEEFAGDDEDIENYTSLVSMFPLEVIVSFLIQANSTSDQARMDLYLDNPELMLSEMSSQVGEPKEQQVLTDLPELGEKATGVNVLFEMGGQDYGMDMVVFRREWIAVFAVNTYLAGADPVISVHDIATLLDERLQAALDANGTRHSGT